MPAHSRAGFVWLSSRKIGALEIVYRGHAPPEPQLFQIAANGPNGHSDARKQGYRRIGRLADWSNYEFDVMPRSPKKI